MNEENKQEQISDNNSVFASKSDPTSKSGETEKNSQKKQRNGLFLYVSILFAVAFLLVVMSYFIEVRNNSETISQLNETSMGALDKISLLQEENQRLLALNDELTAKADELSDTLDAEKASNATARAEIKSLESRVSSLETTVMDARQSESEAKALATDAGSRLEQVEKVYALLWQAKGYYDRGDYENCKNVLTQLDAENAGEYLSSTTDSEVILSPAAEYKNLLEAMS